MCIRDSLYCWTGVTCIPSCNPAAALSKMCIRDRKERSIENLTNDLKYGGYGEEDQLEMTELLFREQTILENLTEVIAATKEKLAVYEAYENKKQ